MPRVWYMFFIILIAFVAIFLIFIMFYFHSENHLTATDLQQAVTEDLQMTRDDSARMEKGVYAINEKQFMDNLQWHGDTEPKIVVKNLNKHQTNGHAPYMIIVRFLNDKSDTDSQFRFGQTYSTNMKTLNGDGSKYNVEPIRGVQVIAVPYGLAQKAISNNNDNSSNKVSKVLQTMDKQNDSSSSIAKKLNKELNNQKYVSSIIIQSFDRDANDNVTNGSMKSVSSSDYHNYLYGNRHTHTENSTNNETDLTDNDTPD